MRQYQHHGIVDYFLDQWVAATQFGGSVGPPIHRGFVCGRLILHVASNRARLATHHTGRSRENPNRREDSPSFRRLNHPCLGSPDTYGALQCHMVSSIRRRTLRLPGNSPSRQNEPGRGSLTSDLRSQRSFRKTNCSPCSRGQARQTQRTQEAKQTCVSRKLGADDCNPVPSGYDADASLTLDGLSARGERYELDNIRVV